MLEMRHVVNTITSVGKYLTILLIITLTGCATSQVQTGNTFKTYGPLLYTGESNAPEFTEVSITVTGQTTALLSGKVSQGSYVLAKPTYEWINVCRSGEVIDTLSAPKCRKKMNSSYYRRKYGTSINGMRSGWGDVRSKKGAYIGYSDPQTRTWRPNQLNIQNPGGADTTCDVESDGSFSATIKLDSSHRYHKYRNDIPNKKYAPRVSYRTQKNIFLYQQSSPKLLDIDAYNKGHEWDKTPCERRSFKVEMPKFWFTQRKPEKAKQFAKDWVYDHLCTVKLNVKEQVTRRNISPQITISPTNASLTESIASEFTKAMRLEFDNDQDFISLGKKATKYVLSRPLTLISHFEAV